MPLNPFASAFTPGLSHPLHKTPPVREVSAPPALDENSSQPRLASDTVSAVPSIVPAASVAGHRDSPFAEQQASTNSSAEEALQLEFEDLFQRGTNVSCMFIPHFHHDRAVRRLFGMQPAITNDPGHRCNRHSLQFFNYFAAPLEGLQATPAQ